MQNCITFTPTIQKSLDSKNNIDKWNEALDLYDAKDYRKSIFAVFDYLDREILLKYFDSDRNQIVIPQGSAMVTIDITETDLTIKAPFVRLPEDKQLPILRKCTEINFNTMVLPQILLEGDVLSLNYSMPIELCEPYKLYDALKDIATNADKYDDEFVGKFGATRLVEPKVTHYGAEELKIILENTQKIAQEAVDYAAFFETKRDQVLTADALFIGLNRIRYYSSPAGVIGNKVNESVDFFFNRNADMPAKIKNMRAVMEQIKALTIDEATDVFFIGYQLIPVKYNASRGYLKDWIARQYDDASSMLNKENYSTATSYSLFTLYLILGDFNIDDNSRKAIEYSLRKAAGKPFHEAASILVKALSFFYLNEQETFPMEDEDTGNVISNVVGQYKSMIGNFMKGFGIK